MTWSNLKTDYKNILWNGLRKYQMIDNHDGTFSFRDVTEYINTEDANLLAAEVNKNNDTVNKIMNGQYFYFEDEVDTLLSTKQNVLTFDDNPTAGSSNPVKSQGIKSALDAVNSRIDNLHVFSIHVCSTGEYDPVTGQPTIQNPDPTTFYLVPSGTAPDVFTEWVYVNNAWELFGSTQVDLSNYVTIDDLEDALDDKQDVLTFDSAPAAGSDNPVTSAGIKTALDGKSDTGHNHDDRYYTESEIDTLLAGKSDTGHNHDDRYYTETEMDTLLAGKRNVADSYTKTEVDTLLSAKSDNTHNHDGRYYTEAETDALLADKADIADLGALAEKDKVDWDTDIDDIPVSFPPAVHNHDDRYYTESEMNTLLAEKANSADLGDLATLDSIDYSSNKLTNKPSLGTLSEVNDVSGTNNKYYGRRNAAWVDLDTRYYKTSGGTITDGDVAIKTTGLDRGSTTAKYSEAFILRDENNETVAVLQANNTAAGTISANFYASNTDPNDSTKSITNALSLRVAVDGTRSIYVTDASIWRTALACAPLASPTFTGTPKAPTASSSTNNTQIATTAFVHSLADAPKIFYGSGTISAGATSRTFSNSKITATMRLINFSLGTPRNVPKAITCTIAAGKITFSGTFLGATTIDFLLAECETLTLT